MWACFIKPGWRFWATEKLETWVQLKSWLCGSNRLSTFYSFGEVFLLLKYLAVPTWGGFWRSWIYTCMAKNNFQGWVWSQWPFTQQPKDPAAWQCGKRRMIPAVISLDIWTMTLMVTRKIVAWTIFLDLEIFFFFSCLSKQPLTADTSGVFGSKHLLCYSLGTDISLELLAVHSFLNWFKAGFLL